MNACADHAPIDAVVTWVDGNDPGHRAKREAALRKLGKAPATQSIIPAGKDPTRFQDNGEIRWCLHSIRKFAPWIRTIHLVTDNQVPAFLTEAKQKELGVRIVDHTEIFRGYEWALPTFNTRTIESALWRIEGLAERFVYFNDDFVILQPVPQEDFFIDGKVVCRGQWKSIKRFGPFTLRVRKILNFWLKKILGVVHTMHKKQQMDSARSAGFTKRYYHIGHVPHPQRKSTIETFFQNCPKSFEENVAYPFRSIEQYSVIFLAYHLEIQRDNVVYEERSDGTMVSGQKIFGISPKKALSLLEEGRRKFLCLQNFEDFDHGSREAIATRLDRLLGID
ncbi:MAG: Stealth CR1 domain-containing protein [Opitutales bacterium]|nr:Stealth CR1 domain-containing protein [Opitutales bacterium]